MLQLKLPRMAHAKAALSSMRTHGITHGVNKETHMASTDMLAGSAALQNADLRLAKDSKDQSTGQGADLPPRASRSRELGLVLLLTLLTGLFFGCGVYMDLSAASLGVSHLLTGLNDAALHATSQGASQGTAANAAVATSPELAQKLIDFQSTRIKNIEDSAQTAYDIAKIALGALVSAVAQLLSSRSNSADTTAS